MPVRMINAAGFAARGLRRGHDRCRRALRRAPGFISHTAHVDNAGITATEVWETREQWRAWFDTSVRPHLPADAAEPEVIDLHHPLGR